VVAGYAFAGAATTSRGRWPGLRPATGGLSVPEYLVQPTAITYRRHSACRASTLRTNRRSGRVMAFRRADNRYQVVFIYSLALRWCSAQRGEL
jgi:hypothetical protein